MKPFVYITLLAVFMLFYNNKKATAQVDLTDSGWELFFDDEFDNRGRSWNESFVEQLTTDPDFQPKWRCCMLNNWPSNVVTGPVERHKHVYQRSNVCFSRSSVNLVAEFKGTETLLCDDFETPVGGFTCQNNNLRPIYYYSGMLETIERMGFGYYEVRCNVPVHPGSCSAFWFWANTANRYGEIDVMEYFQDYNDPTPPLRKYVTGIWYNPDSCNYGLDSTTGFMAHYIGHGEVEWDPPKAAISSYHKYACEWMPDHITWYLDDEVVNDYRCSDSIPQHTMFIRITHPIDWYACDTVNGSLSFFWTGNDYMSVDYVRGYRLKTDCDTDAIIQTSSQFASYEPSVKRSITIGCSGTPVAATSSTSVVMRATDHITINNEFEVPLGGSITLMTQPCPRCSNETN